MLIQPTATTHHLAGNKTGLVTHQEQRQVGDILWLTDTPERRALLYRTEHLTGVYAAQEFIVDQPRSDRVYTDTMLANFCSHCPGVAHHRGFRSTVVRFAVARTNPPCNRSKAHHLARFLLDHMRQHGTCRIKCAVHVR